MDRKSLMALLGILAVAGYQNRDKISEWLNRPSHDAHGGTVPPVARDVPPASSSMQANLDKVLGGVRAGGVGGLLSKGLSELVDHFTKGGHGETASSWVNQGANRDIHEADLERAIGPSTLDHLQRQTGLGRSEILSRLSRELPSAIDRYATDGRRFA